MVFPTLATFLDVTFAELSPRAIALMGLICFLDTDKVQEAVLYGEDELNDNKGIFQGPLEYVLSNPWGRDRGIIIKSPQL